MSQHERHDSHGSSSASGVANESNAAGQARDLEQQIDFRVMRCFCGCTALTFDQIEHFAMMNVHTLIVHPVGKKLFQNFLRIGHLTDRSEAMDLLDCYEICDKIQRNRHLIHNQDTIDSLLSTCPSWAWETRITNIIENNNTNHLQQILNDLKTECIHSIECHHDFDRFKRELLRKIGRS